MTFISKIKYKLSLYLLKIYSIFNNDFFLFLSLTLKVVKYGNGKKNIFVFTKAEFKYDIEYISTKYSDYSFHCLEVGNLKRIQKNFFLYHTYTPSEYLENFNKRNSTDYNKFMSKFIKKVKKKYKFPLIISCNLIYTPLRNLGQICEEQNIKYLIIYKEGLYLNFSEDMKKSFENYAKKNLFGDIIFKCDTVCCINEHIKNEIILNKKYNINVKGQISITGLPRFERAREQEINDINLEKISKKYSIITLFDLDVIQAAFRFEPRIINNDTKYLKNLEDKILDLYEEILNFIKDNPKFFLIFKIKPTNSIENKFNNFFYEAVNKKKISDRVLSYKTYDSLKLINYSKLIISMPSTICLETICRDKKLLIPNLKSFFNHNKWHFFFNNEHLVYFFETQTDIESLMQEVVPSHNNSNFLDEMIALDKVGSSTKIINEIEKLI